MTQTDTESLPRRRRFEEPFLDRFHRRHIEIAKSRRLLDEHLAHPAVFQYPNAQRRNALHSRAAGRLRISRLDLIAAKRPGRDPKALLPMRPPPPVPSPLAPRPKPEFPFPPPPPSTPLPRTTPTSPSPKRLPAPAALPSASTAWVPLFQPTLRRAGFFRQRCQRLGLFYRLLFNLFFRIAARRQRAGFENRLRQQFWRRGDSRFRFWFRRRWRRRRRRNFNLFWLFHARHVDQLNGHGNRLDRLGVHDKGGEWNQSQMNQDDAVNDGISQRSFIFSAPWVSPRSPSSPRWRHGRCP